MAGCAREGKATVYMWQGYSRGGVWSVGGGGRGKEVGKVDQKGRKGWGEW